MMSVMNRLDVHITALYYYPVKSCAGVSVETMRIVETGPRYDRELMMVDAATGVFLTQRHVPSMALVRPMIVDDRLALTAPGMERLVLDLTSEGPRLSATIWKDQVESVDQGDTVAEWCSLVVGRAVRLVRKAPGAVRLVDHEYATDARDQVGFADGYPLLLISQESLAELNRRLPSPLPMDRFRPNVVIGGCPQPHDEDAFGHFDLGLLPCTAVKPCVRCKITTVDQQTAEMGKEPLQTLAAYRRSAKGVTFGMNLVHHACGRLQVGDAVCGIAFERATSLSSD